MTQHIFTSKPLAAKLRLNIDVASFKLNTVQRLAADDHVYLINDGAVVIKLIDKLSCIESCFYLMRTAVLAMNDHVIANTIINLLIHFIDGVTERE